MKIKHLFNMIYHNNIYSFYSKKYFKSLAYPLHLKEKTLYDPNKLIYNKIKKIIRTIKNECFVYETLNQKDEKSAVYIKLILEQFATQFVKSNFINEKNIHLDIIYYEEGKKS